jgi:formylglycine-generating enzyme required for sulfatase activity
MRFRLPWDPMSQYEAKVEPFFLDIHEVTVRQFRKIFPVPSSALAGSVGGEDFPITGVTFDEAVAYAELAGKRLPDEEEYIFAATDGGQTVYPWGDHEPWLQEAGPIRWNLHEVTEPTFDQTRHRPPIRGLFSNAVEWSASHFRWRPRVYEFTIRELKIPPQRLITSVPLGYHLVVGGPEEATRGPALVPRRPDLIPRYVVALPHESARSGLGFRCARSARPRFAEPQPPGRWENEPVLVNEEPSSKDKR